MRLQAVAGALALAGSSVAFSDSSPWVLLSTSPFNETPNSDQLQAVSQVLKSTKDILAACPTERYLVVAQPGTTAADLQGPKGCTMPHLCRAVEDSRVQGKFVVSEVIGKATSLGMSDYIKAACAQKDKSVIVEEMELSSLSGADRVGVLGENNDVLGQSLETTTAEDSYTILFYSTPGEQTTYEPDFAEPVRMDLKRDIESAPFRRQDNGTIQRPRSLFEKYQFFTPGIFMGLITAIILFTILGVGLKALSSLEVSYGAFEKDMGPAAQKKQQ